MIAVFNRNIKSGCIQAQKLGAPFPPMRVFRKKFAAAPSNSWRHGAVAGVRLEP
jgi:hypothetical protein